MCVNLINNLVCNECISELSIYFQVLTCHAMPCHDVRSLREIAHRRQYMRSPMEWRALVQWRAPGNHCFLRPPSLGDKPSFCGLSPYIYRLSTLPGTSAALCSHILCYFALGYIFSSTDTLPQLSSSSSCGRHWQVHIFFSTSHGHMVNPLLRHVSHSSSIYSL